MTVKVKVTAEDIGSPGEWENDPDGDGKMCMLDKAITRAMGSKFYTMFTYATEKGGRREVHLPKEAIMARVDWDRGMRVQPFSFMAEVVER